MTTEALDDLIAEYHATLDHFMGGDSGPVKKLFSRRPDVTLANPFGPTAQGWNAVERAADSAAPHYKDGRATHFETLAKLVTAELAYLHEVEHFESKVGGRDEMVAFALRVTTVFRREEGVWRVVHRHADPITTTRPPESVLS